MSWSLQRTPEDSRAALAALTLPRGPFDLDTAVVLVAAAVPTTPARPQVADLVDRSLVQRLREPGPIRFRILEPIRLSVLASDLVKPPAPSVHAACSAHYLSRAEAADTISATTRAPVTRLMREDEPNLRAALEWGWANDPDGTVARIGSVLFPWYLHGRHDDVLLWSERIRASAYGDAVARARVALCRLSVLQESGDGRGEWPTLSAEARAQVRSFDALWHDRWIHTELRYAELAHDTAAALAWLDRYRQTAPRITFGRATDRAEILYRDGRLDEAEAELTELVGRSELGEHPHEEMKAWDVLGHVALTRGDHETARARFCRALDAATTGDTDYYLPHLMASLAWCSLAADDARSALGHAAAAAALREPPPDLALDLLTLSALSLGRLGRATEAARVAAVAVGLPPELRERLHPVRLVRYDELAASARAGDRTDGAAIARSLAVVRAAAAELGAIADPSDPSNSSDPSDPSDQA